MFFPIRTRFTIFSALNRRKTCTVLIRTYTVYVGGTHTKCSTYVVNMRIATSHLHGRIAASATSQTLLALRSARLRFSRNSPPVTQPLDLSILRATSGGHVILGANGCGKSLVAEVLHSASDCADRLAGGDLLRQESWNERSASLVSFSSHQELLAHGGSVYGSLSRGGTLSAAARFLVVRFGLHPLLYKPIHGLSTGEVSWSPSRPVTAMLIRKHTCADSQGTARTCAGEEAEAATARQRLRWVGRGISREPG